METIRSPQRRIEDFQVILKGSSYLEGITSFGRSKINVHFGDYIIDIPTDKPGVRLSFVLSGGGILKKSERYIESDPSVKQEPLSPAEKAKISAPIFDENMKIDEALASFQEEIKINPHDKEVAIEEEARKIAAAIRYRVLNIEDITPKLCESKSDELRVEPSKIVPSVVNSFKNSDWKAVIQAVRSKVSQNDDAQQAA